MSDSITFIQMQSLLENLVRNLDNSDTSKFSRSKLDSVIESLDKIKGQLDKNNDTLKTRSGESIDYNRLSASIVSAIRTGTSSETRSSHRSSGRSNHRREHDEPIVSNTGRRSNSLIDQWARNAAEQSRKYNHAASSAEIFDNKLAGLSVTMNGMEGALKGLLSITGITKAFAAAKTAITERSDSYRTMMVNGMTFGGDILQMSRTANTAGMTLSNFTQAIANSSQGLKQMGPEVFAQTTYQIKLANSQFGDLGLTSQQTSEQLSAYMERLRTTGHLQQQTASSISSSFRDVIQTSTSLAAAVGTSRDAIIKASNDIANNTNNRALLHLIGGQAGQNVTSFLSQMQASLGGGPEATKAVNAMMKASRGVYTPDVYEVSQAMGAETFQSGVRDVSSLANTNTQVSPVQITNMLSNFLNTGRRNLNSRNVDAAMTWGEYGQNMLQYFNDFNDARADVNAARTTQQGQQKQTPLTSGMLNSAAAKEALDATKEALSTEALSAIQDTLGNTLNTWNRAVLNSIGTYQNAMNAIANNPLSRGLDSMGGSIISTLGSIIPSVGIFTAAIAGIGAIKIAGALKSFVSTLTHLRHSFEEIDVGRLMRERGINRYDAHHAHRTRQRARDRLRTRGNGRRGLLGRRFGGMDFPSFGDIRRRRGSGLGRTSRLSNIARGGLTRLRPLASGLATAVGIGSTSGLVTAANIAAPLAALGAGAWWNHKSTQDFRAGKISSSQNNINHDSNYGMMGGAALGAALGTMFLPVVGTAIGTIAGGLVGYGGGHMVGSWANSGSDNPAPSSDDIPSTPGNPQATPPVPNETVVLLQRIIDQLSLQNSSIIDQENALSKILQSIDRNTGDAARQMKRVGNTL